VEFEFDPAKDARNREKHGVSLALAAEFEILAAEPDDRFDYGEERWRAWGRIEGVEYCLVYTMRRERLRAISLRRASRKEMARHVSETD
jgi:uncharacterized DUF497 family protein